MRVNIYQMLHYDFLKAHVKQLPWNTKIYSIFPQSNLLDFMKN